MLKVFRYLDTHADGPFVLDFAEFICTPDSTSWIERYRDPGEFTITGKVSSGLQDCLPIGTFISHTKTYEVMVVENHHIIEDRYTDGTIEISGRSFETVLDQRVVGSNLDWGGSPPTAMTEYELTANYTWEQCVYLINKHILETFLFDIDDVIPGVHAYHNLGAAIGSAETFIMKKRGVHESLLELLAIDDLGIRTIRKNPFGYTIGEPFIDEVGDPTDDLDTVILIHPGVDKTDSIVFSWVHGDIESAEYLWTNKNKKDRALVVGRYVEAMADITVSYDGNTRTTVIDATDIDGYLETNPTGTPRTTLVDRLTQRGNAILSAKKEINIARVDISNNGRYQYRRDYEVGDIVTVLGNRGETATMRVIEHAEIEDENGFSSHPTLSVIES